MGPQCNDPNPRLSNKSDDAGPAPGIGKGYQDSLWGEWELNLEPVQDGSLLAVGIFGAVHMTVTLHNLFMSPSSFHRASSFGSGGSSTLAGHTWVQELINGHPDRIKFKLGMSLRGIGLQDI
ncbi:hypothetical protein BJV78DRAFT_1154054 [Lactifluus subvellereus]|nr:hypothetical protein BJV78DRAFT_1154054 [Lactifluus subvellereus]